MDASQEHSAIASGLQCATLVVGGLDYAAPSKKLLDQVRDAMRLKHYSLSTER